MAENNGKVMPIVMWLFAVIVFPVLFFLGNNVIANDNNARARDDKLNDKIRVVEKETAQALTSIAQSLSEIKVAQMEIKTDQKYMRELIKNVN